MVIQSGVSTGKDNNVLQNGNLSDICLQDMKAIGDDVTKSLSSLNLMFVKLEQTLSSMDQKYVELEKVLRKQEQQMEMFKFKINDLLHEPVNGVCDNLSQLGYDLDSLNQMVSCMKDKIMKSDEKQDPTNLGVWHLRNKADGHKISGKAQKPIIADTDEMILKAKTTEDFIARCAAQCEAELTWLQNNRDKILRFHKLSPVYGPLSPRSTSILFRVVNFGSVCCLELRRAATNGITIAANGIATATNGVVNAASTIAGYVNAFFRRS